MKAKSRRHNTKSSLAQTAAQAPSVKTAAEPTVDLVLQFGQNEISALEISDKVKSNCQENGIREQIQDIKIYVKPEENKAYYVINGGTAGNVTLV